MKKTSSFSTSAAALALTACATVSPLNGRMEMTGETFTGTVTGMGPRGGSGDLTLVSSQGGTCRGSFVYTSRRRAEGVLTCSDGRSGPFHLAAIASTGSGFGELRGSRFTFTFVSPE